MHSTQDQLLLQNAESFEMGKTNEFGVGCLKCRIVGEIK